MSLVSNEGHFFLQPFFQLILTFYYPTLTRLEKGKQTESAGISVVGQFEKSISGVLSHRA